jgi:hypothetical protein
MSKTIQDKLKELNVKGYFFVRQKRIPTILGQGVAFGIDRTSYAPMIPMGNEYVAESFLFKSERNGVKGLYLKGRQNDNVINIHAIEKQSSCLISVDADVSPSMQSMLDGSSFCLEQVHTGEISKNKRKFTLTPKTRISETYHLPAIYVTEGTPYKFVGDFGFSTKFGSEEDVKTISFIGKLITNTKYDEDASGSTDVVDIHKSDTVYGGQNGNIIRGIYTGIIGICGSIKDGSLYNIRIPKYSNQNIEDYFDSRKNDYSTYFAISDRYLIDSNTKNIEVYRGDCYTNTVTVRLNRNFIDPEVPLQDTIVDDRT